VKVVVKIVAYDKDTGGEEDGATKEFTTLKEALDYVFDDLEGEVVELYKELYKDSFGRYVFRPKNYDEYYDIEYIVEISRNCQIEL